MTGVVSDEPTETRPPPETSLVTMLLRESSLRRVFGCGSASAAEGYCS